MLDIPIINDMIHEGDEFFALTIVGSSLPSRISRGNLNMATVTIVDTTGEWHSYYCQFKNLLTNSSYNICMFAYFITELLLVTRAHNCAVLPTMVVA